MKYDFAVGSPSIFQRTWDGIYNYTAGYQADFMVDFKDID
jgi:hypothetical protein